MPSATQASRPETAWVVVVEGEPLASPRSNLVRAPVRLFVIHCSSETIDMTTDISAVGQIAVVGAGITGLLVAQGLQKVGSFGEVSRPLVPAVGIDDPSGRVRCGRL